MEPIILTIHLILALAIIGLVLVQRSEGGGLGIGGGGGGMGGFASPRGAANFLTRATAICAACFFATSLLLGILAGAQHRNKTGILEDVSAPLPAGQAAPAVPEEKSQETPVSAPLASPEPEKPSTE
jgi:preprotein translocase subunit SecG